MFDFLSGIGTFVTDVFKNVGTFFEGLWNFGKDVFSKVGSVISKGKDLVVNTLNEWGTGDGFFAKTLQVLGFGGEQPSIEGMTQHAAEHGIRNVATAGGIAEQTQEVTDLTANLKETLAPVMTPGMSETADYVTQTAAETPIVTEALSPEVATAPVAAPTMVQPTPAVMPQTVPAEAAVTPDAGGLMDRMDSAPMGGPTVDSMTTQVTVKPAIDMLGKVESGKKSALDALGGTPDGEGLFDSFNRFYSTDFGSFLTKYVGGFIAKKFQQTSAENAYNYAQRQRRAEQAAAERAWLLQEQQNARMLAAQNSRNNAVEMANKRNQWSGVTGKWYVPESRMPAPSLNTNDTRGLMT